MICSACGAPILQVMENPVARRLVHVRLSCIRVRLVDETVIVSGRCKRCDAVQQISDPQRAMVAVSEVRTVRIPMPAERSVDA